MITGEVLEARSFVPLTQCAWCKGIKLFGHYLRVPGLGKLAGSVTVNLPVLDHVEVGVSHGICPSCIARVCVQAAGQNTPDL